MISDIWQSKDFNLPLLVCGRVSTIALPTTMNHRQQALLQAGLSNNFGATSVFFVTEKENVSLHSHRFIL
jgi:hypothetical protein